MLKPLLTPPGKYSIPVVLNSDRNSSDSDPCSSRYWTAAPPNALSSSTALYAAALHYDDDDDDDVDDDDDDDDVDDDDDDDDDNVDVDVDDDDNDNDDDNNNDDDTLFHLDCFLRLARSECSM